MTATDTIDAATTIPSAESLQKLEALASQNGWTLDKSIKVAAALLKFVLDTDSSTAVPKAYTYNQNGDRYSFQINR